MNYYYWTFLLIHITEKLSTEMGLHLSRNREMHRFYETEDEYFLMTLRALRELDRVPGKFDARLAKELNDVRSRTGESRRKHANHFAKLWAHPRAVKFLMSLTRYGRDFLVIYSPGRGASSEARRQAREYTHP